MHTCIYTPIQTTWLSSQNWRQQEGCSRLKKINNSESKSAQKHSSTKKCTFCLSMIHRWREGAYPQCPVENLCLQNVSSGTNKISLVFSLTAMYFGVYPAGLKTDHKKTGGGIFSTHREVCKASKLQEQCFHMTAGKYIYHWITITMNQ